MKATNPSWKKLLVKIRIGLIVIFLLGITFIFQTVSRHRHAEKLAGQWVVFDSQNHMHGNNNPDGFKIEHRQNWIDIAYEGGGEKNKGDLRARFTDPFFIFDPPKAQFSIWWRRVDETWTLEDVRDWYISDLGFGINRSELENARNIFRPTTIGKEEYSALSNVFWRSTYSGRRVIVLIEGNEAFILDFKAERLDTETLNTFNRMLDSFEVYD